MHLEQLPEELLLTIAHHLPDSETPRHLKSLSLTSRKLLPIAQEALFTTARLTICCGCHPKVNALIKLLRTVLDRPDLAAKVRSLRFRAVRKRVEKMYAEQGFELLGFRDQCVSKLEQLGYQSNHPWWRSINNCVESSFGGLLLALLPNLTDLDFWVKDHQRGPPSSECISGLWGGTSPPQLILSMWKNVRHLIAGDTSMLKCGIYFERLTTLDLRTISIGTVLRLNGPGSLQGAENVVNLSLTASIQFTDRPLVEKAEIAFSDLLDALNCSAVRNLKVAFINDGYHIGDDLTTELSSGYFLDQLRSVENLLETLSISFETTEDDGELDWLIDMCQHPADSMTGFTSLKSLVLPHCFLFNRATDDGCMPRELPPNLEQLELLYPHEGVEEWADGLLSEKALGTSLRVDRAATLPKFKKLILTCRDDAGMAAHYFTDDVDEVWWTLSVKHSIEAEVRDQLRGVTNNLAGLYHNERIDKEAELTHHDDSSDEDNEDEGRAIRRLGTGELMCEDVQLQTDILEFTRYENMLEDAVSVSDIAKHLSVDEPRIRNAIRVLRNAGNIVAPSDADFFGDFEISFIKANSRLQDIDDQSDLDSDEELEEEMFWNSLPTEMPDPAPSAVSAVRIAILRTLRELHKDAIWLSENTIHERFSHMAAQSLQDGDNSGRALIEKAMKQLFAAEFIYPLPRRAADGSRMFTFLRDSAELLRDDHARAITTTDAVMRANDDEDWKDDDTDEEMPDLEGFDPTFGATVGPAIPPGSRVGLVTETAVLRFVRQRGVAGVPHEEISAQLGTNESEVILRVARLRRKGHVREDEDAERVYFVSANAELVEEDMS